MWILALNFYICEFNLESEEIMKIEKALERTEQEEALRSVGVGVREHMGYESKGNVEVKGLAWEGSRNMGVGRGSRWVTNEGL